MNSRNVTFHPHHDFSDVLAGCSLIAAGIGPFGDAMLLVVAPEDASLPVERVKHRSGASFAPSTTSRPYAATVIHWNAGDVDSFDIPAMDLAFPDIQPLSDGRVLVASARCRYNGSDPYKNAVIYDMDGQVIGQLVLGDGIASVQVDRQDRIWVSYFDEGIFGNLGWDDPIGASGLVCFNTEGQILWKFQPTADDYIADCYALNVASSGVWICYYTEFPVVQITKDFTIRRHRNEVAGASALAVDGWRVLHGGGHHGENAWCTVQKIAGDQLTSRQKWNLKLPTKETLQGREVIGRDSTLHTFVGPIWYQFDLRTEPS